MNPDPDLTIVLLGKAGVGKSASGNTILGRAAFKTKKSLTPVTKEIHEERGTVFEKQISVIDTPGILNSKNTKEEIKIFCDELLKSSRRCLFLVVIRVGRFTEEDQKAVRAAHRVLGTKGLKKSYLLFSGGDALKGGSLEDFIFQDGDKSKLLEDVRRFAGAYHLFNNKDEDKEQVRELLQKSGHLREQEQPADDPRNRRIILLGHPGAGKSSSGNTILGSRQFRRGCGFNPVSTETVCRSASVEGRQVSVVDTPGFTDEVLTPEQLYDQIMSSVVTASPGPHAFIIVVRLGRISAADVKLFELINNMFDSDVCDAHRYSMVLFTHGDDLEEDESIDKLIQSNRHVSDLVSMCDGRFCVFNNRDQTNRQQVRDLLNKIDEMVTANGEQHFTNDMFRMAETFIREKNKDAWSRIKCFFSDHKKEIIIAMVAMIVISIGVGAAAGAGKLGVCAAKTVSTIATKAVTLVGVPTTQATATAKLGAVVGAAAGVVIDGVILGGTAAYAAVKKD